MKGKTKKILAGVGLGAMMATTGLFAGCSSDIKFNQADLDRALTNVNEYLQTQNNYSSEFVRNKFVDYLVNGITNSEQSDRFGYTYVQSDIDQYGNVSRVDKYAVKVIKDTQNNKIYEYCKNDITSGTHSSTKEFYNEITCKKYYNENSQVADLYKGGIKYDVKSYSKEGTNPATLVSSETNQSKITPISVGGGLVDTSSYSSLCSTIYGFLAIQGNIALGENYTATDVIMRQDGNKEVFEFAEYGNYEDEIICVTVIVKFENAKLSDLELCLSLDGASEKITVSIDKTVSDIAFEVPSV